MSFNKKLFSELLIKAQGNNTINKYSEISGVSSAHISRLQRCLLDTPPNPEILNKLSIVASNNVTYNDLMTACGFINDKAKNYYTREQNKPMQNLQKLMQDQKISNLELSNLTGISYDILTNYINGDLKFDIDDLINLSKFFNQPTDVLLDLKDIILYDEKADNFINKYELLDTHAQNLIKTITDSELLRIKKENEQKEYIKTQTKNNLFAAFKGEGLSIEDTYKNLKIFEEIEKNINENH